MNQTNQTAQTDLRTRILTYAYGEFIHRGIKSVKMDDIAMTLGVSKRTIYEMFGDKENLLLESLLYREEVRHTNYRKLSNKAQNLMEVLVEVNASRLKEMKDISTAFIEEAPKYNSIRQHFQSSVEERRREAKSFMQKGVDEGLFRPEVNFDLLIRLQDILGRSIMEQKLYEEYTLTDTLAFINDIYVRGLCTPKGLEKLNEATKKIDNI